jgi:hypothetical protein
MPFQPPEPPRADVYIDESSQNNHRFLVIGGVITATADVTDLNNRIQAGRLPELPRGTMKWGKISKFKLAAYKRVVDLFFERQPGLTLDFHCLVVDTTRLDHKRFNEGSREVGFNKEIFQIAAKFGRLYRCLFHIYLDRRTTNQLPEKLRTMLNFDARKKGDKRDWPFRRLQFRDPENTLLLQLADILIGAVAFTLNGHHLLPGASPAKRELAAYILMTAGITDVHRDTKVSGKFTIWHRKLQ